MPREGCLNRGMGSARPYGEGTWLDWYLQGLLYGFCEIYCKFLDGQRLGKWDWDSGKWDVGPSIMLCDVPTSEEHRVVLSARVDWRDATVAQELPTGDRGRDGVGFGCKENAEVSEGAEERGEGRGGSCGGSSPAAHGVFKQVFGSGRWRKGRVERWAVRDDAATAAGLSG